MYPAQKLEPVGAASYKVRAFRRPEVARVLGWALRESTSRSILKEFEAVYPRLHHNGEIHDRYVAAAREPLVWEEIHKNAPASIEIPRGDNAQQVDQRRKDLLEPVLLRELVNASERDPKEHHIEDFLRNVSDGSKTIVICETKFEARLLSERLTAHGFPARWYAGRSVKRSERLSDNLEAFRRGEVRILCGTSAVETGHDIAEVSYILRYVPVTSRKKNGQAKGRAARQEGLTGEYQTVAIDDPDTDINEMTKVYRARTKLFAEERSQRRYE
jgi:superfamily II DNA/RNA helicase